MSVQVRLILSSENGRRSQPMRCKAKGSCVYLYLTPGWYVLCVIYFWLLVIFAFPVTIITRILVVQLTVEKRSNTNLVQICQRSFTNAAICLVKPLAIYSMIDCESGDLPDRLQL